MFAVVVARIQLARQRVELNQLVGLGTGELVVSLSAGRTKDSGKDRD
jgi:hypothetical protein